MDNAWDPLISRGDPNSPELSQRWDQFLADPRGRGALASFGLSLLQPMGFGQSDLGHLGQAVSSAGDSARASEAQDIKRLQETRADEDLGIRKEDLGIRRQTAADRSEYREGRLSQADTALDLKRQQGENVVAKANRELNLREDALNRTEEAKAERRDQIDEENARRHATVQAQIIATSRLNPNSPTARKWKDKTDDEVYDILYQERLKQLRSDRAAERLKTSAKPSTESPDAQMPGKPEETTLGVERKDVLPLVPESEAKEKGLYDHKGKTFIFEGGKYWPYDAKTGKAIR
jgi:hypothetical protein